MVWLALLGRIQWRVSLTIFASIVKLDILTLWTALLSWMLVASCFAVKPHLAWWLLTETSTYQIMWFHLARFFLASRAWSLRQPRLLAAPDTTFPNLLTVTGMSHACVEIDTGTVPISWFVVHLKKVDSSAWSTIDLLQLRLLLFASFTSSWLKKKVVEIFHQLQRNMLWPAPLSTSSVWK